jgi:hypothetical protein
MGALGKLDESSRLFQLLECLLLKSRGFSAKLAEIVENRRRSLGQKVPVWAGIGPPR